MKYLEESKTVKEEGKGLDVEGKEASDQGNGDPKSNIHSIQRGDEIFDNWWERKWCLEFLHNDTSLLTDALRL